MKFEFLSYKVNVKLTDFPCAYVLYFQKCSHHIDLADSTRFSGAMQIMFCIVGGLFCLNDAQLTASNPKVFTILLKSRKASGI